jgi:hypothetical protein
MGTVASAAAPAQDKPAITRTTITPSPGTVPTVSDTDSGRKRTRPKPAGEGRALFGRRRPARSELAAALPPHPGGHILRTATALLLGALCLLTVFGAILMLLLWQQDKASGVLSTQLDRTWNLFDVVRDIERILAFAVVPVACAWIALAAVNAKRATGRRRDPVVAALSLPVGLAGIWLIGAEIVAEANDWVGEAAGVALQAVFAAIPFLALERIAEVAEARHGPLRTAYVMGVLYLVDLQFLGAISTVEETASSDEWGRLGAYLLIAALIQVLGSLSANEAMRAIEEGTDHRYQLRHKFGESLLAQL